MDLKISHHDSSAKLKERNIIVLEFGRQYTRCGFAGEPSPRAIIRTVANDIRGNSTYLHDIVHIETLEECLGQFLEKIYFSHLAVSPKEKMVVVIESVFCKSVFRKTLTKVLFDQFNVPSLIFVPDHLMALASLGLSTGLVLDLGSEEAISIAVVGGVTLLDGAQFASLGSKALDSFIAKELVKNDSSLKGLLDPATVEDIRIKSCFVAPFERGLRMMKNKLEKSRDAQKKALRAAKEENLEISIGTMNNCYFLSDSDDGSPTDTEYSLGGCRTILIPANLREGSCEIFFDIFAYEHSLTTMIIETILMAPIDCRRALSENILVIGGLSNIPGLEHRLSKELQHVDQYVKYHRKIPDNFKFHKPICPRNYVSWLGGSMFCTNSFVELRSTTKDQWLKDEMKSLRDWSDLII